LEKIHYKNVTHPKTHKLLAITRVCKSGKTQIWKWDFNFYSSGISLVAFLGMITCGLTEGYQHYGWTFCLSLLLPWK
jgi:hypothetical protein